jgi:DNA-binding NtrC family response regulator
MTARPIKVLVVDDDQLVLRSASEVLQRGGYEVISVDDAMRGITVAKDPDVEVALFSVGVPQVSGLDLLRTVKQWRPELEVIMMTALATVDVAVEAVKAGAHAYLTKPFENLDEVVTRVAKAAEHKALRDRARVLEKTLHADGRLENSEIDLFSLANLPYSEAKRLALRAFERRYLSALLERHHHNVSSAARAAQVDRSNFRRLLKQYDVARRRSSDSEEPESPAGLTS